MSTSTAQIYEAISSHLAQQEGLAGLTPNPDSAAQIQADLSSGSRVSIHRLLMWVVAYAMRLQQALWERFRKETEDLAADGHYGTRRWFVARAKAFQFGHVLVMTDKDAHYAVDAPEARIVTHAAVAEMANLVVVKVAKSVGGGLVQLSPPERTALAEYFHRLRPPVQVTVLTAPADRVRITGQIVYDGQYDLSAVQAAVAFEVREYLGRLDFGGAVRNSDIVQAIARASGVVDVRMIAVMVATTGPWVTVPRVHYTYAGHARLDAGAPLSSSMTWQVGVI